MRVQLMFILLLLIAASATSIVWREFASARAGDTVARVVVLALTPVGIAALSLAGRIVVKAQGARERTAGSRQE